ncbi:hypothetical protein HYX16_05620 [Candidatus Woesearchaeota archaeon]|nr:hypothetical protein [Candidatus Woesearchaeota archaeon]
MPETAMKWNLDDILPVDKFSKLHSEIEEEIKKINEFYELLAPEMEEKDFKRYMEFNENLGKKLSRLRVMPELMQAADQKSQKARELNDKATDLALKYSKESRKIEHWIQGKKIQGKKQLDENNAKRLFSSVPALTYVLSHLRRSESYTLQEREEEIISNKNRSGSLVLTKLRDLIETEFSFEFQPDKTRKPQLIKTSSELHAFRTSQDPKEREESYVTELKKYKENIDKFFMIYQAIVKDWVFESIDNSDD